MSQEKSVPDQITGLVSDYEATHKKSPGELHIGYVTYAKLRDNPVSNRECHWKDNSLHFRDMLIVKIQKPDHLSVV